MIGDEMFGSNENVLPEQIVDAIWNLWRNWRALSHPVRQGQITPEQYWILHLLHRYGPLRIKDIAGRTGTGSSSVTIAVKRLERDGVVMRRRDNEEDERVVTVHLTEKGRELFRSWRQARRRALLEIFAPLDDQERRQLYTLLTRVGGRPETGGETENGAKLENTAGAVSLAEATGAGAAARATGPAGANGAAGTDRANRAAGADKTGAGAGADGASAAAGAGGISRAAGANGANGGGANERTAGNAPGSGY